MKKELQKKLYDKYPKIFEYAINRTTPAQPMFFGIETADGWFILIDHLCAHLQFNTDHNKHPQIKVVQVKEKFGTLRFYIDGGTSEQHAVINFAESLSSIICEECGSFGNLYHRGTWLRTLCAECAKNNLGYEIYDEN